MLKIDVHPVQFSYLFLSFFFLHPGASSSSRGLLSDPPPNLKKWTKETIQQHIESKSATVVILDNLVYDVTNFKASHPGGPELLEGVNGQDATQEYIDTGHSQDARELLREYVVGELEE